MYLCVASQSGEYVFGGYITSEWRGDGVRFGTPKCFLFSVTLDLKLPYHGRQKSSQGGMYGMGSVQHDCVMCTPDMLQFGLKDLTIQVLVTTAK